MQFKIAQKNPFNYTRNNRRSHTDIKRVGKASILNLKYFKSVNTKNNFRKKTTFIIYMNLFHTKK